MRATFSRIHDRFEKLLEAVTIILMVSLALIVLVAVGYRLAGHALAWYDEVASIMLAWLTYYAGALAVLKRAHIGVPGVVNAMPTHIRVPMVILAEVVVIGFFAVLAWYGYVVVEILDGDTMISLPWVSTQFTQSVIPIGGILFIVAQILTMPELLDEARAGKPVPSSEGITP